MRITYFPHNLSKSNFIINALKLIHFNNLYTNFCCSNYIIIKAKRNNNAFDMIKSSSLNIGSKSCITSFHPPNNFAVFHPQPSKPSNY